MFSKLIYFGDGINDTFAINFTLGILERDHVKCRVNNEVDGSDLPVYRTITWINDGLVTISGDIPEEGVQVVFTRTVSKTIMRHDYVDGAIIIEDNLDDSNLQLMMAIHELLDGRFEASPGIGDGDYATMEQLSLVRDDLQAQIDALSIRMDDLSTEIQEDMADLIQDMINDALDDAGLASGDRLIQHTYDEYTDTNSISTLLPYTTPPVSSEGTEILSCTITAPTIGNTVLCTVTALGHPSGVGVSPALAMFINGEWVRSTNVRSSNNNLTFPQTMSIVYQMDVTSTDDIVVTVNAGPTIHGTYITLNSGKVGGQGATLTAQEIGAGAGGGGEITIPEPGDTFQQTINIPGSMDTRYGNTNIIYTFTDNVKFAIVHDSGIVYNIPGITLDFNTISPDHSNNFYMYGVPADGMLISAYGINNPGGDIYNPDRTNLMLYAGANMLLKISGGFIIFEAGDQLRFEIPIGGGGDPPPFGWSDAHLHLEGIYE